MKLKEAKKFIKKNEMEKFRVSFEWVEGCILRSDYFPEERHLFIKTEEAAWKWAERLAIAGKGKIINLYVIDSNFRPVPGYRLKMIKNR